MSRPYISHIKDFAKTSRNGAIRKQLEWHQFKAGFRLSTVPSYTTFSALCKIASPITATAAGVTNQLSPCVRNARIVHATNGASLKRSPERRAPKPPALPGEVWINKPLQVT